MLCRASPLGVPQAIYCEPTGETGLECITHYRWRYYLESETDRIVLKVYFQVLLQFCWRRGPKDSRSQGFKGLFSKDFISAFTVLSISDMPFLVYPFHLFQWNLNPLLTLSVFQIRRQNHTIGQASWCNPRLTFFLWKLCCYSIHL